MSKNAEDLKYSMVIRSLLSKRKFLSINLKEMKT
jgi:hypothetical protein